MAKTKKPRKPYRGPGATVTPKIIRIEARQQSKPKQWWLDHKADVILRLALIGFGLLLLVLVSFVWSLLN